MLDRENLNYLVRFIRIYPQFFSAIMLAIPRPPPVFKDIQPTATTEDETEDFLIYDYMMVWKIIFVIIMALVTLGGSLSFFVSHCVSQIYAQPVKKLKIQQ